VIRSVVLLLLIVAGASAAQKYSYWVEPCSNPKSGCQDNDPELAAWAFEAWQNASVGAIEVSRMSDPRHARIRIFWATAEQGLYMAKPGRCWWMASAARKFTVRAQPRFAPATTSCCATRSSI